MESNFPKYVKNWLKVGENVQAVYKRDFAYAQACFFAVAAWLPIGIIAGAGIAFACHSINAGAFGLVAALGVFTLIMLFVGGVMSVKNVVYVVTDVRVIKILGANQGYFADEFDDIADIVCKRSRVFKNCGTVVFVYPNGKKAKCSFDLMKDPESACKVVRSEWAAYRTLHNDKTFKED